MQHLYTQLNRIPTSVFKYRREFETADRRRWYIELVLHGKTVYNADYALNTYLFESEDDLLEYHQFAGCYLKVLREQAAYDRSAQGKIDLLRDDILTYENDIKRNRIYWQIGKEGGLPELQQLAVTSTEADRNQIAQCNKKIIELMTGRK